MSLQSVMNGCDLRRGRGRPRKFDKSGQVFICDWMGCDKKFNQSCNLNKHLLIHSGDRPFACDWPQCGMWFTQSSNLNKHYLTHTNERPFKCSWPDCDKRFKQSSNLNKHKLVHTGEKPYFCDFPQCQKKFSQSSNLKKHKLVHSGEKPFRCHYNGCGKLFDQSCNLNKHYLTHIGHKPYSCDYPQCGEKFSQSSNLSKHYRSKHSTQTAIALSSNSSGDTNDSALIKCDVTECDVILSDANASNEHKLKHSVNNNLKEEETKRQKPVLNHNAIALINEIESHRSFNQTRFNFETLPLSLNMS